MKIPRIVLAGTSSGVGKTSITLGLIHGIKKKGYSVSPFKVGPDYIDPSYLSSIAKNSAVNLDAWIMGKQELVRSFVRNSASDVSVIEGVMGYYDGFTGESNYSSTHHVAALLKAPVLLVLDASKAARSIAATALGFTKFHKNSRIAGLILNKIGSPKHEELCRKALEPLKIPVLGCIPRGVNTLDSRHLGLIPVAEQASLKKKIEKIAKEISDSLNIDKIIKIAKDTGELSKLQEKPKHKVKCSIAVALDSSFNFYYKDNLDALRREGAQLKFFSPVADSKVPACDGLYIGGGFPEVLAAPLAKNQSMKKSVKKLAEDGTPLYAECGGLMYLTKSIHDGSMKYSMVGLFDAETKMTRKMTLNYTKGTIGKPCVISNGSLKLQGHEFHFSEIDSVSGDSKFVYKLDIGKGIKNGKDGLVLYNALASYGHLYFDSSSYARNFVSSCFQYTQG
ncbi:MAG TPA: cobyrinate a,c-diamide synthase [Nitrosopumilaceae archaeon]|nr:cobyrinate a,c-diamide synthase [Nitrosopumilaceae archaeon]